MPSCLPNDLTEAAKGYQGISPAMLEAVKVYLLAQIAGLGSSTPDELTALAKCYARISPTMLKGMEVALLCTATGGVPPCPGGGGGGGSVLSGSFSELTLNNGSATGSLDLGAVSSVSNLIINGSGWSSIDLSGLTGGDIQVEANPSLASLDLSSFANGGTVKLGGSTGAGTSNPALANLDLSSFQSASGNVFIQYDAFTSLILDALTSAGGLYATQNPSMATFSAQALTTITNEAIGLNFNPSLASVDLRSFVSFGDPSQSWKTIYLDNCPNLVSVRLDAFIPDNGKDLNASGAKLDVASVDQILARHVANAGYVSGTITLSGGTSAAPTGQGILDKATLIGRGVTVNTN